MFEDEVAYLRHRAEIEAGRARQATRPEVVAVHHQLAAAYRNKLDSFRLVPADQP